MLRALGMELYPLNIPEEARSNSLTAFAPLEGLTASEIKNGLQEGFGLSIAGGIGELKGKVLRIGHMGHFYDRDALTLAACLEAFLKGKGLLRQPGAGVAACMDALLR